VIIVTGSEGFIGKNLISRLDDAVCLDINNRYDYFRLNPEDITHVYHMGAISDTTCDDLNLLHENNVIYSIELFEWCIEHQIPVSYASSASIYGNGTGPLNYYATSKLIVDMWVQDHIDDFKSVHGYRFFNVYGDNEDHKGNQASPITQFTKQAKQTGNIKIFDLPGDGERDFIWVGDVCKAMQQENRPSGIYDCGTCKTVKFSEVAKLVAEKYNASIEVIPFPEHLKRKYQFYTCANTPIANAITIEQYLNII
jgi:ADP-L-glycero-D-manno-heptose 6-epimerase